VRYYHIRILYNKPGSIFSQSLYETDLATESVIDFSKQYSEGGKVLFNGKWIDAINIGAVQIRESPLPSGEYPSKEYLFSGHNPNILEVTRQFIKSPPLGLRTTGASLKPTSKNVFIVHGHDIKPVKELKEMLKGFGLNPIVLHEKPSGSRTIIEKLEKYSDVEYAFVILTPDDLGGTVEEFMTAIEGMTDSIIGLDLEDFLGNEIKYRARQNVILEFGYFIGRLGRDRVCCLYKGDVELPSDMQGIVYIYFKDSVNEIRDKIIKELKEAGYQIPYFSKSMDL